MTARSRSAIFYSRHPEARRKKAKTDAEINKRPDQVKKRVALNRYNRIHKDPVGNKTDAVHKGKKIVGYAHQSVNRADRNDTKGDRRARGRKR